MTTLVRPGVRGLSPALIPLGGLFLAAGLSTAMSFPFLSLFLSNEVHAAPGRITLFLVASPLAGVLVATRIGRLSDRYPIRRRILIGAALAGCVGAGVTAYARNFWVLLTLSVTAMALAGSLFPQTFAYARQILERDSPGQAALGVTAMRTVFSAAFVAGPPIAAVLLDTGGFRLVYGVAAAMYAVAAVVATFALADVDPPARGPAEDAAGAAPAASRAMLWTTIVAFVLLQIPMPLSVQAMPLFIEQDLHAAASRAGVVLGVCAALEIPLMLGLGALTTRYRPRAIVLAGAVCGVAYYVIALLAPNVWTLGAGQVVNAVFISAVAGVGISYVQDMLPGRPGQATTMFTNTFPVGIAVAGPLLGLSAHFGYRLAYALAAILCAAGLLLLASTRPPEPVIG